MKKIVASLVFSCLTAFAWAQFEVFDIGQYPDYTTCDAIMHDNNGGLVPYSANFSNEIIICSDAAGDAVNLYFIGFNLSPGDSLYLFDGTVETDPFIGAFSGESLLFQTISSTNVSGCLLVRFISNDDANVGDFSARIFCGTPCDFPFAVMEGSELNAAPADTVKICPGESVEFDATGSDWTDGATPTYLWDFGDETTATTTGSVDSISHTYPQPGGYRVRLRIQDSNDCFSANLPEILVFVSTPYNFDLTASSTSYCLGNEVLIGTQAYVDTTATIDEEIDNGSSETWVEDISIVFENGIYIPDNQGCLESEIVFTNFESGALVESPDDLSSVYFNMEHSFVGDITITVICPNGQLMSIFPEAGGSGTFLGEPIDDTAPNNPGVGYDYSFSPNSTGGTWMEYLAGGGGGAGTIPAGDYEPEGSFDDLIGCPLNGTWTLEVCDIVGADDGYVFEFGIQFAPIYYPEALQFTPIVGNGCDSSYWVNPSVFSSIGGNCDWAIFNPATPGTYTFEYEVVNDFGCVFTDDITIEVVDRPNFTLTVQDFCNSVADLQVSPSNPNYTYTWTSSSGSISGGGASVELENISDTTSVSVVVDWPAYDNCETEQSDIVNYIPLIQPTSAFDSCRAVFPLTLSAAPQVNPGATYSWTTSSGSVLSTEPDFDVMEQGTYTLTVSEPTCPYTQTSTFRIAPPLLITDSLFDICVEELPFVYIPETQNQAVTWSWSYYPYEVTETNDTLINFLFDNIAPPSFGLVNQGEYMIDIVQMQNGCTGRDTVNIQFVTEYCTLLIPNIITPNGDGDNDKFKVQSITRYPGSTCQIFNRWGNLVFEDNSYDGTWDAAELPDGVYYYVIGVKRSSGMEYHSGDLTVIR